MCESLLGFNWLKKYLSIFFFGYFVTLYETVFFFKVLWFLGSLKVLHVNIVLIKRLKN